LVRGDRSGRLAQFRGTELRAEVRVAFPAAAGSVPAARSKFVHWGALRSRHSGSGLRPPGARRAPRIYYRERNQRVGISKCAGGPGRLWTGIRARAAERGSVASRSARFLLGRYRYTWVRDAGPPARLSSSFRVAADGYSDTAKPPPVLGYRRPTPCQDFTPP